MKSAKNEMKDIKKIRLNRYLQRYEGISRRHADGMIKDGRVRIDERIAELGVQVQIGRDKVTLDGREVKPTHKPFSYIVMNKPKGYICSRKGYRTVFEVLPEKFQSISYVGRLDVNTTGALIFTDDGDFSYRLLRSRIPRKYIVTLDSPIDDNAGKVLENGPMLDGRKVKMETIEIRQKVLKIKLFEGKWREVRRIFDSLGYSVLKLHRESFGPVDVGRLESGRIRQLEKNELQKLKSYIK